MSKMPTYNGGKLGNGTYQNIINHIPPHGIYVAPFAGHDGVFQKIRRADLSILNDADARVVDRWKTASILNGCLVSENFYQGTLFERPQKPIVVLRNGHYSSIIDRFNGAADAFIYCDPPYMMETRRSTKKLYRYDWADQEHYKFLEQISKCNCNIMISHYECNLYNKALEGWNVHRFSSMTRAGLREEIIYYNYPKPAILHDFRYLGHNYRDRERIKRKVIRFENKLARMPEDERAAILSNIIAKHKTTLTRLIEL